MHLGPEIQAVAQVREALLHDGVGDDRIDLNRRYIFAAAGERPRHVPAAAGTNHQRLRAGPQHVRKTGPFVQQVRALLFR